jgi:hypothetical protein
LGSLLSHPLNFLLSAIAYVYLGCHWYLKFNFSFSCSLPLQGSIKIHEKLASVLPVEDTFLNIEKLYFRSFVVQIQVTGPEDETITDNHTVDVFGFTFKNIYMEV